ncbi:MAG: serine hydrolase [Acidobacteria bacterium]|nr:serine hydrolase [Acidobacteriota bacterium]
MPVTPQTIFGIGSITKSVTVLALSSLADEGKLDWDRPVRDYASDFHLHDPVASDRATLRDLVSHRTGLPRHDGMWFTGLDRNGIFARLRYLEPSRDFRAAYQYNNVMYMAAGVVGERAAGRSWETLVRERVFAPLGMASANFSVADAEKTGDLSRNYSLEQDTVKEIPPTRAVEAICPAGCINANLEEMTAYLKLYLAGGARVEKMREAQIAVPAGSFGPERLGPGAYGMGVVAMRYRGRLLVFHTGTIGGYHALLAYLPEERAGVMIMQNRVARNVPKLLSWWIWDRLLDLGESGWFDKFAADEKGQQEKTAAVRAEIEKKRRPGMSASRAAAEFAGVYTHPAYGEVRVEADGDGKLTLHYGGRARPLAHWHYDV